MSLTATTAKLCVTDDNGSDRYYYKVEIEFPGTYTNDTVSGQVNANTSGSEPYPVEIKFLNDTDQVGATGTSMIEIDLWLDDLPWGSSEPSHISIDVKLLDEADQLISGGGGVVSQSQAEAISRPWPEVSENGTPLRGT